MNYSGVNFHQKVFFFPNLALLNSGCSLSTGVYGNLHESISGISGKSSGKHSDTTNVIFFLFLIARENRRHCS